MKTYVIYYTNSENERCGYETTGSKNLVDFIRANHKLEGGHDYEVYRINNLDDRDDCTRMETYELY